MNQAVVRILFVWVPWPYLKNRVPNIEFLDDQLLICGNNHILQKIYSLYYHPFEMITTSRLFAIINVAVCMPVSWLADNTHKLSHHNWGSRLIGIVFDTLHTALNNILVDMALIHERSTTMFIFQEMIEQISAFKAFLVYEF